MWKSLPLIMSAMSRSRTGSAKALKHVFISSYVARKCVRKALSHLSKTDLNVKSGSECGSFSWRTLCSLLSSGCIPERQ